MPVYLFQTPFVERAVVCHQRQSLDKRSYFAPNVRKIIGFIGIYRRKPMYFGSPQGIIIRIRTYKPVYFIDYPYLRDCSTNSYSAIPSFGKLFCHIKQKTLTHCITAGTAFSGVSSAHSNRALILRSDGSTASLSMSLFFGVAQAKNRVEIADSHL